MPGSDGVRPRRRPSERSRDALRGHPPRDLHHRRRAGERRLLRPRPRAAARQEDRQPGRPDRLPPLLRRRGRAAPAPTSRSSSTRAPGAAAPGAGMVHTIAFRVASDAALDFWEERLRRRGGRHDARPTGGSASTTPRVSGSSSWSSRRRDAPLVARHPEIPRRARAAGLRRRPCVLRPTPSGAGRSSRRCSAFAPTGETAWEVRGRGARWAVRVRPGPGVRARASRAPGTVHHVAWSSTMDDHVAWQQRVAAAGCRPTPVIDRFWFRSVYFREPSGVLFEIATLGPGFAVDEDPEHLGRVAHPAARVRAPPRAGRADPHADHQPAGGLAQ